ncbi:MAG TPA: hypothetical protein VGK59_12605 [Ohtaekwangia sp.]
MKKLIWSMLTVSAMVACQEGEKAKEDFTGNEATYPLVAASEYDIDGSVTFREKTDGTTFVIVTVSGTEGDIEHPVHLHLGNIAEPGADVYANLNPVLGKTGESETHLTTLADESAITYQQLVKLFASMKIHLSASGPQKDIVLAAGNIGTASSDDTSLGRLGVGTCKSN